MIPTHQNFEANAYTKNAYGWKIHLNIGDQPSQELLQKIVDFCCAEKLSYKIGKNGGQPDKGMTLYVGSYNQMRTVAAYLQQNFANMLLPPGENVLSDDRIVEEKIGARFDPPRIGDFAAYGSMGVPYLVDQAGPWNNDIPVETKLRRAIAILSEKYGEYFHGSDKTWLQDIKYRLPTSSKELSR